MGRGGKRKGAGRPKSNKPSATVVKRVSRDIADKIDSIENLLQVIKDWDEKIQQASSSSPRWQKAREFMEDIQASLDN